MRQRLYYLCMKNEYKACRCGRLTGRMHAATARVLLLLRGPVKRGVGRDCRTLLACTWKPPWLCMQSHKGLHVSDASFQPLLCAARCICQCFAWLHGHGAPVLACTMACAVAFP